ncbi:adenylosuccinate lyase [Desulfonatronospira sp.]|uniref:adenylosuccinate lyase n=1 Tax=Desulfonatronospira sp. TaxID=1962951 RepID=UPI0025C0387C|nr:adenylosuccinate lyase [Desulfonatronospira sp.]
MIERYTKKEMGELWTQENRFRAWLEVELAICEAWHELGAIPAGDMENIRSRADFELHRILEIEERTKHDVIAFLSAVEEKVGSSARYIHLGCTSSDIVDTANALLLYRAGKIIAKALEELMESLSGLSRRYRGRLMMGRTHGIHAEPISFGQKMAGFYAEMRRHQVRWEASLEQIRVGKISGAVGTYAHLDPELEERACKKLGLEVDPVSTQIVQRDRYADYFTTLALMAGGIERLCVELRHLQRTEVLEAEEGFTKGQKGSSAMPHKKNPISAENLTGLSRLVRSNALASMENMALWHERDISHSSVERVIMPDSTILMHYMLTRLKGVLDRLQINESNMEHNLDLSMGLYFSQRVLLALVEKGLERQEAYELVQEDAMYCWDHKINFPDRVRENQKVLEHLTQGELDQIFDRGYYLKHEDLVYKRVFN